MALATKRWVNGRIVESAGPAHPRRLEGPVFQFPPSYMSFAFDLNYGGDYLKMRVMPGGVYFHRTDASSGTTQVVRTVTAQTVLDLQDDIGSMIMVQCSVTGYAASVVASPGGWVSGGTLGEGEGLVSNYGLYEVLTDSASKTTKLVSIYHVGDLSISWAPALPE